MKNKISRLLFVIFLVSIIICSSSFAATEDILKEKNELELIGTLKSNCACIMQGNTNEEDDALEVHVGLKSDGYYGISNITEYGWTYYSDTSSSINTNRVTENQYIWGGRYTFSYYTGHGSRANGIPVINYDTGSSNQSGTFSEINIPQALDVDGSDWRTTCEWQDGEYYSRVHILAACNQLDSTVMKYYARAMRASDMRVIAGYHGIGPGHPTDVNIAEDFFEYCNAGNSVKYSWEHGNEDNSSTAPWAVLVYKENNNQYFRIPGFPGNTYTTPSSTADIYRYASHLSNSQLVSLSKNNIIDLSNLPLYINTQNDKSTKYEFNNTRESLDSKYDIRLDSSITDNIIKKLFPSDKFNKIVCIQTPVVCSEVNPDFGHVSDSEVVVERMYKYFDTYNNVRVNNSFINFFVDCDGINTVTNKWKSIEEVDDTSKINSSKYIDESTAIECIKKAGYEDLKLFRISLVYQPVKDGLCKLNYEYISTDDDILYVDVENGVVTR
jgi:hypothetical protein